jgi:hypothetical protein
MMILLYIYTEHYVVRASILLPISHFLILFLANLQSTLQIEQ